MTRKYYFGGLMIATLCVFTLVAPAQALDLRFKSFFEKFLPIEKVTAEENNATLAPLVADQPAAVQPINNENVVNSNPPPLPPPPSPSPSPLPPPPTTCRVNGVDMPGDCSQYPASSGGDVSGNSTNPSNTTPSTMPVQSDNQTMQPGPSEEQMAKQQAQRLKDMQRGLKPLKSSIIVFEKMMAKGNTLSDVLKAKIVQAKELVARMESAKTADEVSNEDMDLLRELMNDLQEEQQSMQRLTEFRRNITNTERGVKDFERQLTRLQKQKIVVPTDVTENLGKIKQLITVVKTANNWEEMQSAGVEDMGDLMNTLNESRNTLEMLARWPQTLKQMDKEITNLNRQVKKAKSVVARLLKKEIDLTDNYNKFVEMADKLKVARDDAKTKMAAGDSEGAFNAAQDDFFEQLEETYQNMRVIETMSNLGLFTSSFRSDLNKAKQVINQLKKKKINVTELQTIYDKTKVKGDETLALIKIKPIDEEAVIMAMEEMEDLRVEFGDKVSELQGEDAIDMPWEQGPQQFKAVQMAPNFNQYFPQPMQPTSGGATSPTCNINGVETPGSCK